MLAEVAVGRDGAGEDCSPRLRRGPQLPSGVERAERDVRASARAEILGAAMSSADCAVNAWPDDPYPLVRTMQLALQDAGLGPGDVDVVYASANATRVLDGIEARALVTLFGGSRAIVTSIKGAIGECGASGAAACAAAILCGAAGRVPPVAGLRRPDPVTEGLRLATEAVDVPGNMVLVNSVASGGGIATVIMRVLV